MFRILLRGLRSVGAVVAGYAVIVFGTTLAFTYWLGSVGYGSPPQTLLLGSAAAVLSGLCGGYVAALLAGRAPVAHAAGVLAFLAVDTTYVILYLSKDPLWFELMGALTLMGATVAGGFVRGLQARRKTSAPSAA